MLSPGVGSMRFSAQAYSDAIRQVLTHSRLEPNRYFTSKLGAKGFFLKSPNLQQNAAITRDLLLFDAAPVGPAEPNPGEF